MILYFSATGNTKYCAEYIASRLNDKIISLNDIMKNEINFIDCGGEKYLAVAAPVYDFDLAYAVKNFLEGLDFRNLPENIYVYGILTCGASCGSGGETLKQVLAKKGIILKSAFTVVMPDNYVPMFPQKSEEEKQKMFEIADISLNEIVNDIEQGKNIFRIKGRIPKFAAFLIRKIASHFQRKVKNFSVNDKCIGCGKCETVCPMNIIVLENKKPVWTKDNCACCLACLHRCPVQAINRGRSAKNGRYINPRVKL